MFDEKSIDNLLKDHYDLALIDQPLNLDNKKDDYPNRSLQIIFFNLLWGTEINFPKFENSNSVLSLLDYLLEKFNVFEKVSPFILERKKEIFYLVSDELLKYIGDKNEKNLPKKISKYFYDKDFYTAFLIKLNKKSNKKFKEKFLELSTVSIHNNI